MLNVIRERLQQQYRTAAYPDEPAPPRPDRFRGLPLIDASKCPEPCSECVAACPTDAIERDENELRLDMGRCLFCIECVQSCPEGAIRYSGDYRLSARKREDLVLRGQTMELAQALDEKLKS